MNKKELAKQQGENEAIQMVLKSDMGKFLQASEDDLDDVMFQINTELKDLELEMKDLKKQRTVLEMILFMVFPHRAIEDGFSNAFGMVRQRLNQSKGVLENTKRTTCNSEGCLLESAVKGKCKDHYNKQFKNKILVPDKEEKEIEEPDQNKISRCCSEPTVTIYEGKNPGSRKCIECDNECTWQSLRSVNLPSVSEEMKDLAY